ncbi:MerR family transcriptional regulator [Micromonospora cathayae]|uniref:MerR family transcriptional regulator n=1 Tax=Micromonospora cathayae TaxID=3028804 RepID=A0ABY7ZU56_9ACTN|nr:MerR family transcriptional regulator [Micromonospora sp. HUAS 3]WDZ86584.1 MerR family transcriptional regulator [Micromonospora sp. HUAS 3]
MRNGGGWSTRELAEIAGTTLKAVRHYHRIGLLEEPERAVNGYKQYQTRHLVRLLRIRRLADLGVPLADIAAVESSVEGAEQTFRALDAELAASIERQQRIREELAGILRQPDRTDLPPGFGHLAGDLSEAERAFLLVCSRVLDPQVLDTLRETYTSTPTAAGKDLDALTEDASEETRQNLAERLAPDIDRDRQKHPRLRELAEQGAAGRGPRNWLVFLRAVVELYNPAQIDVLQRVNVILDRDEPGG